MASNATGADLAQGLIQPPCPKTNMGSGQVSEGVFTLKGVHVKLSLSGSLISWEPVEKARGCCGEVRYGEVDLHDVVGVEAKTALTRWKDVLLKLTGALEIHTFRHNRKRYQDMDKVTYVFKTSQADVQAWADAVQSALNQIEGRPRKLLVFVNPFGGKRQAPIIWKAKAKKIFDQAGIDVRVVHTERAGHADDTIMRLTLEEMKELDGIVAVGGDGLFHEMVNGLLTIRAAKEGQELAQVVEQLRLGHIPAGSTDTVAYTLHGTRSVTTSVLRIVLGDRIPLDVARLDMLRSQTHVFAVSMISYGYLGDLLKESELWRSLGPLRYEYVGAKVLFRSRAYDCKVSYLPAGALDLEDATEDHDSHAQRGVCMVNCLHCAASANEPGGVQAKFTDRQRRVSLLDGSEQVGWTTKEGRFRSIMIVVIPCRSNKSQHGVIPSSHLADGRMHLVMVNDCSNLQYLRFLIGITSRGLQEGMFDFVEVMPVKAVQVRPQGRESSWNCDGELLPENHISVRAHQGLLQVFARGVDMYAAPGGHVELQARGGASPRHAPLLAVPPVVPSLTDPTRNGRHNVPPGRAT